jgi:Sortase domain
MRGKTAGQPKVPHAADGGTGALAGPVPPDRRRGRHSGARRVRRPWAAGAAAGGVLALCIGLAGLAWASHTGKPATPTSHSPLVPVPRGHWAAAPQPAAAPPVARPTSLDIPAIGVRTALIRLGLTASGTLQVPPTTAVAGWYTGSPPPGAIGAAVIAGHIDSVSGPGVFFRLRLLRPGDLVYVRRADRSLAVFRVTAVHSYLKARFPTSAVYGAVPDAQLRLITCGGTFDVATGHYLSNIIVFATLQPRR